jgi:hypothetical protein
MANEFEPKIGALEAMKTIGQHVCDFAFAQANQFVDLGHTPREAGSIVANILIQAAWEIAGCGAAADGVVPDPDKFRMCVEGVIERIEFKAPEATRSTPSHSEGV